MTKGYATGGRLGATRPDPDGGTAGLVTDRRFLIVLGRTDGDRVESVPLAEVTDASYAIGQLKHRLTVETPDRRLHLWVAKTISEATLATAVELLHAAGD
jgi:hypothetical protein